MVNELHYDFSYLTAARLLLLAEVMAGTQLVRVPWVHVGSWVLQAIEEGRLSMRAVNDDLRKELYDKQKRIRAGELRILLQAQSP